MTVADSELPRSVRAELAFTRPERVKADFTGSGVARAEAIEVEAMNDLRRYDCRRCRVYDCVDPESPVRPTLDEQGFAIVDLSKKTGLQAHLARVRAAGRASEEDAAAIRRSLRGAVLRTTGGARLRVLYIAPEGFIMRRGGPDGVSTGAAPEGPGSVNGHDAARIVHADQDVDGTPVRQILRGAAPWLFRHDSPTRRNRRAPLRLVNLWIPLDQVTRPLALMDARTLDRRAHQLRYGLPTDSFLAREGDRRVNDIWAFLHDDAQRWYFSSEMDARRAYVFDTLSTPHGSFVVPGEARAALRYRQLTAAIEARDAGDRDALRRAASAGEREPAARASIATAALQRAVAAMEALLERARAGAGDLCQGTSGQEWRARAEEARRRVIRKSIELRAVALP